MVLLVEFNLAAYREASFPDDRILGPAMKGAWSSLGRVAQAAQAIRSGSPVHFIFHTGHVGSTFTGRSSIVRITNACWHFSGRARRRRPISSSSSCAMHWRSGAAASSASSRKCCFSSAAISGYASSRAEFANRSARTSSAMTLPAKRFTASRCVQDSASQRSNCAPLKSESGRPNTSCDQFLSTVADSMGRILGHFELSDDARYLSEVGRSPVLTRYSKAPEHTYIPNIRAEVLRDSQRHNSEEIRSGMAWLQRQRNQTMPSQRS